MTNLSFGSVDPAELLERLTLYAYTVFGCFPDPTFEPVLKVHGVSPEDLSIETIKKFLDPDDHTVEWKSSFGEPTLDGMLAYLKQVLFHDFIDMKRASLYRSSVYLDRGTPDPESDEQQMSLDDFAVMMETAEAQAIRADGRAKLLAKLKNEPELHELLTLQLDPDGFQAYSNIEAAELLGTTVAEIENRKKRLLNRLVRFQREQQK